MKDFSRKVWTNPWYFLAFGFGTGLLPKMPGTYATIVAIPIYLIMRQFSWLTYGIVLALIIIFAMWVSDKVSKEIGIHDHPGVNIDEIPGFLLTMLFAPAGWLWILLGFILFRFFDILKPWPISWLDKNVGGGFGMVVDDLLAGFFGFVVIQTLAFFV